MGNFREDVRDQLEAIRETIVESWRDLRSFVSETWPALTVLFLLGGWAIWMAEETFLKKHSLRSVSMQ